MHRYILLLTVLYVDQIPPESLVVPADDILAWEQRYGRVPDNAAILMFTNWQERVGSVEAFRHTDSSGVIHFPGFGKDSIDFLLTERSLAGVGVDTLSLDHGPSTDFATHFTLLSTNRWGLENLANLNQIPPSGATLFVGAPKVASGSGGPSRIMAVW
ncbi:MAG: cyclase family protein [Chloroflexi bacterium AL-W]|nr:cyclase family protein [Chloroflexi bacterium AL-N1]NOK64701.1 cyclase family protein [Chloroflexi bacterium AL-N10]NOK75942.1 cyclase family protein [Chloroflexi bacterium AL-N5]NOK80299.1 cyclase family protein [Chloroflexi bacterium AL-W]NOK86812.1 cyclase family protein [Chloroflexi bacterium AL-N15]